MPPEIEAPKNVKDEDFVPPSIAEFSRPTETLAPSDDKTAAKDGGDKEQKGSGLDLPGLLNGFSKTVKGAIDVPSWLPSAESVFGSKDEKRNEKANPAETLESKEKNEKATGLAVEQAKQGIKTLDAHESLWLQMQGRTATPTYKPGTYGNENGLSISVNSNGKVSELTLPATAAEKAGDKEGASFKNIVYDIHGDMLSYDAPSGDHFQRRTALDRNGYGSWKVSSGNTSREWYGKAVADEKGFHTLTSEGPNRVASTMQSNQKDGTVMTSKMTSDGHGWVLQSKAALGDSSEVVRNARYNNGKLTINPQVKVLDSDKATNRWITVDGTGKANVLTAANMEAAKVPAGKEKASDSAAAKPALSGDAKRVADKVLQRLSDSPNPVADLSRALANMDNLRQGSLTRRYDGKHDVALHFERPTIAPAINANIRGFTPGPTHISENVSFTLSNTASGINLENMQGFSGSVTGPRGRERASWTNGMHIGRDQNGKPFVDVASTVQGPFRLRGSNNRFGEQNFPESSPIRHLMKNPDVLSEVAGALRMFQSTDDIQQVSIAKAGHGQFNVSTRATEAKHIPIKQKLESGVVVESIDLDKNLSGSVGTDAKGASLSNMKGMTVKLGGLFGEQTIIPRKVGLVNDAQGPVVHIELEHPNLKGELLKFDVPVSKLQEKHKGLK